MRASKSSVPHDLVGKCVHCKHHHSTGAGQRKNRCMRCGCANFLPDTIQYPIIHFWPHKLDDSPRIQTNGKEQFYVLSGYDWFRIFQKGGHVCGKCGGAGDKQTCSRCQGKGYVLAEAMKSKESFY